MFFHDFNADMDHDGYNDAFINALDADGDGISHVALIDTDGFLYNGFGIDFDGDGNFEVTCTTDGGIDLDLNDNGINELDMIDTNGDGVDDTFIVDVNGDGKAEFELFDTDGDGEFDDKAFHPLNTIYAIDDLVSGDFEEPSFVDVNDVQADPFDPDSYDVPDYSVDNTGYTGPSDSSSNIDYMIKSDIDGDGYAESRMLDRDGDGSVDMILADTTGDGALDTTFIDDDHDGVFEYVIGNEEPTVTEELSMIPGESNATPAEDELFDADGDGYNESVLVDSNGDGIHDMVVMDMDLDGNADTVLIDTDNDGEIDTVGYDTDGDGYIDAAEPFATEETNAAPTESTVTPAEDELFDADGDGYNESVLVDSNGDGIHDMVVMDMDLDGNADTVLIDTDNDGEIDTVGYDTDGDGYIDAAEPFVSDDSARYQGTINQYDYETGKNIGVKEYIDSDGDGITDTYVHRYSSDDNDVFDVTEQFFDLDGDGKADGVIKTVLIDTDGDGDYDTYAEYIDEDNNHVFDVVKVYDYNSADDTVELVNIYQDVNIESDIFVNETDGYWTSDYDTFDPDSVNPDNVSGDPGEAMEYWEFQGDTKRCAVYSQKFIIEQYTGQEVDIEDIVDVATDNGWFTEEGGTPLLFVGKLLDHYGVPNETSYNNSLDDLREALDSGKMVVIGVDSGEYWKGENDSIFSPADGADHAVQVIGIDYSNPEQPMVILNDSGSPDGCGELIPADVFMDAWDDSDCFMVTAG